MQEKIVAGDTLSLLENRTAYPASAGWRLRYTLIPRDRAAERIEVESVAEGSGHRLRVAPGVTAGWAPGAYGWVCSAVDGVNVHTVAQGQCQIAPDPRTAQGGADTRSQARRALEDALAALAAWSPTRRRYKIGDREQEFNASTDILRVISYWQRVVDREDGRPQGARLYFGAR